MQMHLAPSPTLEPEASGGHAEVEQQPTADAVPPSTDIAPPLKPESKFSGLKPFAVISVSYLLYTTTDGAIRMIVLLHAYNMGFSAW